MLQVVRTSGSQRLKFWGKFKLCIHLHAASQGEAPEKLPPEAWENQDNQWSFDTGLWITNVSRDGVGLRECMLEMKDFKFGAGLRGLAEKSALRLARTAPRCKCLASNPSCARAGPAQDGRSAGKSSSSKQPPPPPISIHTS